MNSHHRVSRFLPLGCTLLAAASLLAAPASTFADSKSQSSSGQKRASSASKKQQRSKQEQTKREGRQYKHYESENRVRGFHDNPDRQPHFIENRLGFKIGF